MKTVHLNSLDELDIVDGCYRLDPDATYIVANPIELNGGSIEGNWWRIKYTGIGPLFTDKKTIEDKRPYYRKFERNKRNK